MFRTALAHTKSGTTNLHPGWRPTVLAWTAVVVVVFIVNLSVLIWANARASPPLPISSQTSKSETRETILYMGDCDTVNSIKLKAHIAINILSSLLLLASANCMQCLSSPTRAEIDGAHCNGHFLDIGVLSSRNFRYIDRRRTCFWLLLALSSLPLHLFYNSVIFSTLGGRSVLTYIASQDFLTASTFNRTSGLRLSLSRDFDNVTSEVDSELVRMQSLMPSSPFYKGQSLSKDECYNIFSQPVVSMYKSLALIMAFPDSAQLIGATDNPGNGLAQPWTCYNSSQGTITDPTTYEESIVERIMQSCTTCDEQYGSTAFSEDLCSTGSMLYSGNSMDVAKHQSYQISSCEAESAPGYCGLQLSNSLLIIVIIANAIKALTMIATTLILKFEPIITFGDALRTFLDQPDTATEPGGPYSSVQLASATPSVDPKQAFKPAGETCRQSRNQRWRRAKRYWAGAASRTRWVTTIASCLTLELVAGALLISSLLESGSSIVATLFHKSVEAGVGAVSPYFFVNFNAGIVALSVLSNLPQLAVSVVYVGYYSLFSSMLGSYEAARYSESMASLRVSPPLHGAQRGTYWLTIPFRYSFPLLFAMTGLHWLISQSFFIVMLNRIESSFTTDGEDRIYWSLLNGFGFSPIAIVVAMCVGFVIILYPILLGRRRLPSGIPIMAHNSLALAAACHRDPQDPDNISEMPVMYGVLPTLAKSGRRRVGFSASSTEPLQDGEIYEYGRCPRSIRSGAAGLDCCVEEPAGVEREGAIEANPFLMPRERDVSGDDGASEQIEMSSLRHSRSSVNSVSEDEEALLPKNRPKGKGTFF